MGRNPETGFTAPLWAGEFHTVIGEGRITDLMSTAQPVDGLWPHQVRLFSHGTVVRTIPASDFRSGAIL